MVPILVAAAVSGILAGAAGNGSEPTRESGSADGQALDKHGCKGQNACKGQGGCKTDKHGCKGQNACKGQGGCNMSRSSAG